MLQNKLQVFFVARFTVALSNHEDKGNDNVKTQLVLWSKHQLCTCVTLCSTFLWRPQHDYDLEPSNATFYDLLWRTCRLRRCLSSLMSSHVFRPQADFSTRTLSERWSTGICALFYLRDLVLIYVFRFLCPRLHQRMSLKAFISLLFRMEKPESRLR